MSKLHRLRLYLRAWNIKRLSPPSIAHYDSDTVHCKNCNEQFQGNYCPRCGQDATEGSLKFTDIPSDLFGSFFNVNRGFFVTMWQLFTRPGYLIKDFLQGRRRSYYSPFQCLFVLAAFYVMVALIVNPDLFSSGESFAEFTDKLSKISGETIVAQESAEPSLMYNVLSMVQSLFGNNVAFTPVVCVFVMAMVCKLLFRKKVVGVSYSYVDYVFILAYIQSQAMFLKMLLLPVAKLTGDNDGVDYQFWLIFAFFCYDNKQLYGLSWRSTILRSFLAEVLLILIVIVALVGTIYYLNPSLF